ncbi:PREDICTED: uncharacterized protein LOC108621086 [Drosophila arizonae]|uniref:Uncharacterized protein LOC108621086 n=1 Tax=Drosophila arizonae TaxID=7263 RepID=A0ABM1Q2M6_DROAR|nr:PREDICTED: uncharacterized protein LOC108621086 [Drosophila arizonae]
MVNVPPLLCSTPPPIDFGEDDDDSGLQSTLQLEDGEADEYSEYGLVTDTHTSFNAKVSELPELPISAEYIAQSQPPELSIGPAKTEKATVEAFNYQVKAADTEIPEGQQMSPKHIDVLAPIAELAVEVEQPPEVDDEEEEANTNDNVPSLKLDSLSLYSSGSATPPSTLSPVADEQTTKAPPVCHQVILEDVTDDSDDECSPKKPKELFIPEGAPDFFAIEIIATPTQQASAMNNQLPEAKPEPEVISTCKTNDVADSNEVLPQELNGEVDGAKSEEALSEDDDFGDFADFSAAPAVVETEQVANQDDGFDDFQDFVTPATTTVPTPEDDSDDDFGDFAEPTFESAPPTVAAALPQPPPPAAAHLSIDERVKPVLEIMFPKVESNCAQSAGNQRPLAEAQTLHFGAIEQAHALNYQWSSSEMRHSLVRSLAIDSRNILFGDKWNASMPRFAANLSFDPLKPLKPQAAPGPNFSLLPASNNSSSQPPLQGLEAAAAATAAAATSQSQTKAQPSSADGQVAGSADEATAVVSATCPDDGPAAASIFAAAAATAPLSPALSTDGHGNHFDDIEQLPQQQQQQQQQLDLRGESLLPSPSPSPPPALATAVNSQQLHEITSCNSTSSSINNNNNSFSLPLKETHIYTPSKSDTVVAKTTTLAPIDFDYEIASAGIIIDETVVKKEYRDVEYKPPFGLDSPTKPSSAGKPAAEDDDFSDFQSVPAVKSVAQLQPPRNGTPTFGEQMILSPAILLPQSIPLAKPTIEWGDNAQASINADELARIEELFSHQYKPPTISASVAQQSPKQHQQQQQKQHQEDDEWSDFVSVPVQQQQQQQQQQPQQIKHNNNNVQKARKATPIAAAVQKDDDWSDFVSSTPLPARAAPQFNSGAWQSANFYNNPLSLYQQQQQPHSHSNLVPKYQSNNSSSNNNNSSHNNNIPQQIHLMHDFSTAPTPTGNAVSYQHQHHQHHQQQLQQQQQQQQHHRQQFHLSNAKVAPRISLIPDLSFVAPALPANAGAFMSSLPKPSFSAKK